MSKIYFISDTHFNHKNILKYEPCRIKALANYLYEKRSYYEGIEWLENRLNEMLNGTEEEQKALLLEHDRMLIDKWNSVVKNDDIVWFLGDFAFGSKETVAWYASQLNGIKRMIIGNHDRYPRQFYEQCGFSYVSQYPIILKNWFILSHAPNEYIQENTPYFYIYGHVHSSENFKTATPHSRCVCVERQNFEPIEIEEFKEAN